MKKKLYITRAIRIIALGLAVLACTLLLQRFVLVHYDGNRMRLDGYYLEEKDSLDVVFIGASDCYASFAPGLAYEKFGITSFAYATASATAGASKTMVKEVMRTQKPQMIVIEINAFLYGFDNENKVSSVRNYIDNVPFNENKLEYLQSGAVPVDPSKVEQFNRPANDSANTQATAPTDPNATAPAGSDATAPTDPAATAPAVEQPTVPVTDELIEYYVPIVKYHGTWNDYPDPSGKYFTQMVTQHTDGATKLKGYRTQTAKFTPEPDYPCINNTLANNNKKLALLPEYDKMLRELLQFLKDEKIENVLFIRTPHMVDKSTYGRFKRANAAGDIIKSYGFDYINFERDPETLAYPADNYYNMDHLNLYGANKFTNYLGTMLTEKYGVKPSEKSDKQKKNWDTAVEYYHRLYDYCDHYINNEYVKTGHIQTLEENKVVMTYIDNYAEKGEMPEIKVNATVPTDEPEV